MQKKGRTGAGQKREKYSLFIAVKGSGRPSSVKLAVVSLHRGEGEEREGENNEEDRD
jgi:hypothetical protein